MIIEQLSKMAGSMMTWGHMIWIFFPLPLFCLLLLSMPTYRGEKFGTKLVDKIFFTKVSIGPVYIRLVHVFIIASLLIFSIACRSIQMGFGSAHVPCSGNSCPFHSGETLWYRKANRYRAERNWWLSLFTLVLWLLVYRLYKMKEVIIQLREDLDKITTISSEANNSKPKNSSDKKRD